MKAKQLKDYAEINCKVPEVEHNRNTNVFQNFRVWRRIQGMRNVTICQNGNTALCLVNTVKPVTQNVSQKFVCLKIFKIGLQNGVKIQYGRWSLQNSFFLRQHSLCFFLFATK
jgi:hypothetical protein